MSRREEKLRRAAHVFTAIGEVLALAASGEHPIPLVLERFDQCASECLHEIKDSELRDSLETQISFLRGIIDVRRTDTLLFSAGPLPEEDQT